MKVPIIPPVNVDLICEVFSRLRDCESRYFNLTLQSLLRPGWGPGSKPSTAGLGTSGLISIVYNIFAHMTCNNRWMLYHWPPRWKLYVIVTDLSLSYHKMKLLGLKTNMVYFTNTLPVLPTPYLELQVHFCIYCIAIVCRREAFQLSRMWEEIHAEWPPFEAH